MKLILCNSCLITHGVDSNASLTEWHRWLKFMDPCRATGDLRVRGCRHRHAGPAICIVSVVKWHAASLAVARASAHSLFTRSRDRLIDGSPLLSTETFVWRAYMDLRGDVYYVLDTDRSSVACCVRAVVLHLYTQLDFRKGKQRPAGVVVSLSCVTAAATSRRSIMASLRILATGEQGQHVYHGYPKEEQSFRKR
jgi:hypothetical protein